MRDYFNLMYCLLLYNNHNLNNKKTTETIHNRQFIYKMKIHSFLISHSLNSIKILHKQNLIFSGYYLGFLKAQKQKSHKKNFKH